MRPWAGPGAPRGGGGAGACGAGTGGGGWVSPLGGRGRVPCGRGRGRHPTKGRGRSRSPPPRGGRLGAPCGGSRGAGAGQPCATLAPYRHLGYGFPPGWMGSPSLISTPVQLQSNGDPNATCAVVRGMRGSLHPSRYGWVTHLPSPHPRLGCMETPVRPSLGKGVVSGVTRHGWGAPM